VHEVELELDACAYAFADGQVLRLSVAGADWPNTVAPPGPVSLTVHGGALDLPLWEGSADPARPAPVLTPGAPSSSESPDGVTWTVSDDVLGRVTRCAVRHGSSYDVPHGGTAEESYAGEVSVDRRTFEQTASADCTFRLRWPETDVRVGSTMQVAVTADGYDVHIDATAWERDREVTRRSWHERFPR
jgi:hypothetical protein